MLSWRLDLIMHRHPELWLTRCGVLRRGSTFCKLFANGVPNPPLDWALVRRTLPPDRCDSLVVLYVELPDGGEIVPFPSLVLLVNMIPQVVDETETRSLTTQMTCLEPTVAGFAYYAYGRDGQLRGGRQSTDKALEGLTGSVG